MCYLSKDGSIDDDMDGKKLLVHILLFFCYVHSYAQTVEIVGEIEDDFLKTPLSGVKVSILNPDRYLHPAKWSEGVYHEG